MRSIIGSVLVAVLLGCATGRAQQNVANRDLELHVGGIPILGEMRIGKIYNGSNADPKQVLAANTITVRRGEAIAFTAYLVTGSSLSDVTRNEKLQVTPLGSDCITVTAGMISATPQASCAERIDAAGVATDTFGVAYIDDTNSVYGYDVFAIKITK